MHVCQTRHGEGPAEAGSGCGVDSSLKQVNSVPEDKDKAGRCEEKEA